MVPIDFDYFKEMTLQQMENKKPPIEFSTLEWILRQLPAWKRWYCKKNQPKNYFRVTRIIPAIDNALDNPAWWVQKFQIWEKGVLTMNLHIDAKAYDTISNLPEWIKGHDLTMSYSIYRNQLFNQTPCEKS